MRRRKKLYSYAVVLFLVSLVWLVTSRGYQTRSFHASSNDAGASHHLEGGNVVSMSVYGSERRYTVGVVRNAEMIRENFPGWRLRVYTEVPSDEPRYGVLPQVN